MLFSKTGLQEGLHRHAPVREGGGWCPRQQWVLPAIVIVVNVSIIIIIIIPNAKSLIQNGRLLVTQKQGPISKAPEYSSETLENF